MRVGDVGYTVRVRPSVGATGHGGRRERRVRLSFDVQGDRRHKLALCCEQIRGALQHSSPRSPTLGHRLHAVHSGSPQRQPSSRLLQAHLLGIHGGRQRGMVRPGSLAVISQSSSVKDLGQESRRRKVAKMGQEWWTKHVINSVEFINRKDTPMKLAARGQK